MNFKTRVDVKYAAKMNPDVGVLSKTFTKRIMFFYKYIFTRYTKT